MFKKIMLGGLVTAALFSCGKMVSPDAEGANGNAVSSPAESAIASINSLANDSEAFTEMQISSCRSQATHSTCNSANQVRSTFDGCNVDDKISYQGEWTNTYSNQNACHAAGSREMQSGESVTRTSNGLVMNGVYGGKLYYSTNAHTTYDNTLIPGTGLAISRYGNTKSVQINGLHRQLADVNESILADHSVMSIQPITMIGSRRSFNRTITGGTVRVYDNTNRYVADTQFNNLQWKMSGCCHPSSGSLTTTFSGSKNGSVTMTFQGCGTGKVYDERGHSTTFALSECD